MFTSTFPTLFQTLGPKPNCVWKKTWRVRKPGTSEQSDCRFHLASAMSHEPHWPQVKPAKPSNPEGTLTQHFGVNPGTPNDHITVQVPGKENIENIQTEWVHSCVPLLHVFSLSISPWPVTSSKWYGTLCQWVLHPDMSYPFKHLWFKICARWL